MSNAQHDMLDDVAAYALGTMPPADAARVRAHLKTCQICRDELQALVPATVALGVSAEACADAASGAITISPLLKGRIMRQVRADSRAAGAAKHATARTAVWPAYLVAAACFVIALISTLANLSMFGQIKDMQAQVAQSHTSTVGLAKSLADERTSLNDLLSENAKHYAIVDGDVVRLGDKLYITMHDVPTPPKGKVYQAWTLAKGSKAMAPSVTFVPDQHGVAIVSVPVDAESTAAVAVSVEPEGGSKQPTSKPTFVVTLD